MFHLWIGVMAGVLLAYLWSRGTAPNWNLKKAKKAWRSQRWWLAALVVIILFLPLIADFARVSFGRYGFVEALKTVLLPWAAGVGFGIWLYSVSVPVARDSATRSWIPLLVAVLFVTAIVSEERYGWFNRLQKISIAGGGLEFSAPTTPSTSRPDRSPLDVSGGQQGEGRIGQLVAFMMGLADGIKRDQDYAKEIGIIIDKKIFANDLAFAEKVISPLGKRLSSIHSARGYNDISVLIDRSMIDSFRAFTQGYATASSGTATADSQRNVISSSLKEVWQKACDTQLQLAKAEFLDFSKAKPEDRPDKCTEELSTASALLDEIANPAASAEVKLSPNLPYATLLSAMLLNAVGEIDPAARDLHRWLLQNPMTDQDSYKWFPIYRAYFYMAHLWLRDNASGARSHPLIMQYRNLVELGSKFLARNSPPAGGSPAGNISWRVQLRQLLPKALGLEYVSAPFSWREQLKLLHDSDGMGGIWRTAVCTNDLSPNFKFFMVAHLTNINNYAYFMSQDFFYAKQKGLVGDMEKYADYLVKASMRCLQQVDSDKARISARNSEANFLDTVASVQLALALAPRSGRAEKREGLCKAAGYIKTAMELHQEVASLRKNLPSRPEPKDKKLKPWEASEIWIHNKEDLDFEETGLNLARRRDRVDAYLEEAGLSC